MSKNNEWTGKGRLGKEPVFKSGQSKNGGTWKVCMLSIACERDDEPKVKGKDGKESYFVDWISLKCWGELADQASYLKKGDTVDVTGRLQSNSYKDNNGTMHYGYEINAKSIEQVGESASVKGTNSYNPKTDYDADVVKNQVAEDVGIDSDDLPF